MLQARPSQIDWQSPLAAGLACAMIPTGGNPIDPTGILDFSLVGGALIEGGDNPLPGVPATEYVRSNGSDSGVAVYGSSAIQIQIPSTVTILWRGKIFANPNNNINLFGVNYGTGASPPYLGYSLNLNNAGNVTYFYNNNGTYVDPGVTHIAPKDIEIQYAATIQTGSQILYYNGGTQVVSTSASLTGINYQSTNDVNVGLYTGAGRTSNMATRFALIWPRVLTAQEIDSLWNSPDQLFYRSSAAFRLFSVGLVSGTVSGSSLSVAGVLGLTASATFSQTVPDAPLSIAAGLALTASTVFTTVPPNVDLSIAGVMGLTAAAVLDSVPPGGSLSIAGVMGLTASAVLDSVAPAGSLDIAGVMGLTAAAVFSVTTPNANLSIGAGLALTSAATFNTTVPDASLSIASTLGLTASAVLNSVAPGGSLAVAATLGLTASATFSVTAPSGSLAIAGVMGLTASAVLDSVANSTLVVGAGLGLTASATFATTLPAATPTEFLKTEITFVRRD